MNYRKINSLDELKQACMDHYADFVLQLNFGLRSSKEIEYNSEKDSFSIYNYVDDSEQVLTPKEIMDDKITNIGKGISYGAFYLVEHG